MEQLEEKRINNKLNTYLRAPGILYGVFYVYRLYINGMVPLAPALAVITTFSWNAQYFSNAVAISYGRHQAMLASKIE